MLNSNSKNYKKILIIAGAVALIVSFCFGYIVGSLFTSKNSSELQDPNISIKNEVTEPAGAYGDNQPFYPDNVYQMPEKLVFKNCSSESTLESITLEAIVYPDSASNKKVDWSVAWSDAGIETDVSEYLTVTPTYDGSTRVTVECLQAFEGEIVITVTTRDGGFTATCLVTHSENVSNITLIPVSENFAEDGVYYLSSTKVEEKCFNIQLSNLLDNIDPSSLKSYVVNGRGQLDTQNKTVSNNEVVWDGSSHHLDLPRFDYWDAYVTTSIEDSILKISFKPYMEKNEVEDGFEYVEHFYSFSDDAGFDIKVIDHESGIYTTISFYFIGDHVTSVSLIDTLCIS